MSSKSGQVAHQPGATVDAQGVPAPRDQADQADVGVLEEVVEAVHSPVTASFGNGEPGGA
jgi:hypothetical protein